MATGTAPLILASSSRYRQQLLQRITSGFDALSPDADESPLAGEKPRDLAERLASLKAAALSEQHPDAVVIGSDQVAALGDEPLGKPGNHENAARQLARCAGSQVTFYTAVTVLRGSDGFRETHTDITTVHFRALTAEEIDRYLSIEQPWDCAGSFKSEGLGAALFDAIENKDPTALIGLPIIWVAGSLRRAGIDMLRP